MVSGAGYHVWEILSPQCPRILPFQSSRKSLGESGDKTINFPLGLASCLRRIRGSVLDALQVSVPHQYAVLTSEPKGASWCSPPLLHVKRSQLKEYRDVRATRVPPSHPGESRGEGWLTPLSPEGSRRVSSSLERGKAAQWWEAPGKEVGRSLRWLRHGGGWGGAS